MKSKAMNRPMFMDVENVGIMQGFKDADEGMGMEGGEYDTGAMLERTPSSPEILMNNLRGDMRSVDARMEELAQLVGEEAAMDTPAEVLALLQPVLASQEGIGSLPAGMPDQSMGSPTPPPSPMGDAMPAPDMGMMPPDMGMPVDVPPGPPPTAQAPLQMAEGGFVQRFREGSDEEGVTPMEVKAPPRAGSAQALLAELAATRDPEALNRNFEQLLPLYQQALGGSDRNMTQSQILFDIAQAGLNLAAGTDAQGKPVRPGASFASSLAAAAQGVPERIAGRVGQMEQQEQGVRLAALRGAQDEATSQRALEQGVITDFATADRNLQNQMKLANIEYGRQQQLALTKADLELRNKMAEAGMEPLGKGLKPEWQIIQKLVGPWSMNQLDTEQENLMQTAITIAVSPREEERKDPITGAVSYVTIQPAIPDYLTKAMEVKGMTLPVSPSSRKDTPAAGAEPAPVTSAITGLATPESDLNAYTMTGNSLFNLADVGTGPLNVGKSWLSSFPVLGEFVKADEETSGQTYMKGAINTIARALGETERFGIIEKNQILDQVRLLPALLDRADAFRQRVIGIDNLMLDAFNQLSATATNPNLPVATRQEALAKQDQLRRARTFLGAPPRVYNAEQATQLEKGAFYLWVPTNQLAIKR
jgi:hypothetical protein